MTRLVLLHSPLLGPSSLHPLAEALRALGYAADAPAWPLLSSLEDDIYEGLADAAARQIDDGEPVILVAHSGAGALVPALADRLSGPAGAVFMDAILPHPGRSWFETAPADLRDGLRSGVQAGLLPPWHAWWPPGALERLVPEEATRAAMIAELDPIPAAYFEAVAPAGEAPARSAYLKLSDAYEEEARLANRLGWPLVRLPLDHLAPLTQPGPVALALQGLAERLEA